MKTTTRLFLLLVLFLPLNHCDWGMLPVRGDAGQDADEDPVTDGLDTDVQVDDADTEVQPVCGNSRVEEGETCDPPSSCPTECNDGDACTVDSLVGSAEECTADCVNAPITDCSHSDGCCPAACNSSNDSDCSASCGNGVIDEGETCDPPASCPADCIDSDPCTDDTITGSAANCNVDCPHTLVAECSIVGDGCCPAVCNSLNDDDCEPVCGNGAVEEGETCDPETMCPTSCDDGDPCSIDELQGAPSSCNSVCTIVGMITACLNGDECCPTGCNSTNDDNCSPSCGNGVVESGEECDFSSDFCVSCHFAAPADWTSCTDSSGNRVFFRIFDPGSNQTWAQARDFCVTTITGLAARDYDYIGLAWFTDSSICTCIGPLLTGGPYFIGLFQDPGGSEPAGGWYWTASPDGTTWSNVGGFTSGSPCIYGSFDNAGGSDPVDCGRLTPPVTFSDYGCDTPADWDPICMVQF